MGLALSVTATAMAQTTTNPYGIEALWTTSDWVAKAVLMILAIMSMGSWYILITKFLDQRKIAAYQRADHRDSARPRGQQKDSGA